MISSNDKETEIKNRGRKRIRTTRLIINIIIHMILNVNIAHDIEKVFDVASDKVFVFTEDVLTCHGRKVSKAVSLSGSGVVRACSWLTTE